MKLNTDKCHLILSCYKHEHICAKIRTDLEHLITNIGSKLKFDVYV